MAYLQKDLYDLQNNMKTMSEDELDGVLHWSSVGIEHCESLLRIARFYKFVELEDLMESIQGFFEEVTKVIPGRDI